MSDVPAPTPVILDCDPGIDDAFALAIACTSPALDVRAVTTVCGNAGVTATTINALTLLTLFGEASVPVGIGADVPRAHAVDINPAVHGAAGLGRVELPAPAAKPSDLPAIDLMAAVVEASDTPVTLIATGPLTNVAAFVEAYPELAGRLDGISVMGGTLGLGNVTRVAEFNAWFDPHAAGIVFSAGIPIVMAGLDVTRLAVVEWLTTLPGRSPAVSALRDMYVFYAEFYWSSYGRREAPLHDAVPVCALLYPDAMETLTCSITVETHGPLAGRTVPHFGSHAGRHHVSAIVDMDTAVFERTMRRALEDLNRRSA